MASTSTARRPNTSAPTDGSRTIVFHDSQPRAEDLEGSHEPKPPDGVLRLRGGPRNRDAPRVKWKEEVIDNEGCGKKKSKICCIYHKPRAFDESSSDESDSSCDSDSSYDDGRAHSSQPRRHRHPLVDHDSSPDENTYERQPPKSKDKASV